MAHLVVRKVDGFLFQRETVQNERTFSFKVGLRKDVLLMVRRVFRRLQGKEMRKEKGAGASKAFLERLQQDEATKVKTLI